MVLSMAEWGVMHISMMFFAFKALFRQGITGKGYCPGLAVPVYLSALLSVLSTFPK